jgi:hypothetical protein
VPSSARHTNWFCGFRDVNWHYRQLSRLRFQRDEPRHGTFGLAGIVYVGPFLKLPSGMTYST